MFPYHSSNAWTGVDNFVKLAILLICITFNIGSLYAQSEPCGAPDFSEEFRQRVIKYYPSLMTDMRNIEITQKIPIKAHIIRMDDMSGGLTFEQLALAINFINTEYKDANIEFYVCEYEEAANTDYFEFNTTDPDNDTEEELAALTTQSTSAVNIYFVNDITTNAGSVCGYARFPFDDPASNRIVMRNSCTDGSPQGTLSHEFGHYFALAHTHAGTENGPGDDNAENVPRTGPDANCLTDGDLLCDTEADPSAYSEGLDSETCTYIGDSTDINGVVYDPPINNIMSYWPDYCGGIFTADQYTQIGAGLADRLMHTEYDFSCVPEAVALPSDLAAQSVCGDVKLTWTDESSNELGYIIERSSTSANAGFEVVPYAAVGPDATSFTDGTAVLGTTYWYRIKAINGDPDTYSNTAEITPEEIYCTTITTDWFCPFHVHIANVSVGDINNTSDCDIGGYACFTDQSTAVEAEGSYQLDVELDGFPSSLDHFVSVKYYADWNEDGDFDDPDEDVLLPAQNDDDFFWSGTVIVPAGVAPGEKRLRVRAYWNLDEPFDPTACQDHPDNEAEDYTLVIADPLPVKLLSFDARRSGKDVLLNWTTTDEVNNQGFRIMHSDAPGQFEQIGWIDGNLSQHTTHSYSFRHEHAGPGLHYYLLEQVDFDGDFERSPIRAVEIAGGGSDVQLYPNPANDLVSIHGLDEDSYSVLIFSSDGRIVTVASLHTPGTYLDITNLINGLYIVEIQTDTEKFRRKLVINR